MSSSEIDPAQAEIVRWIFEQYASGVSPATIAQNLNERRTAHFNGKSEWVVTEVPSMHIVSDELWARLKERQLTTLENFSRTTTNRLNRTHRPSYLLSGMLECAECGGSYAIMAKERYGCSNHKNKLPIDGLDGACCSNHKTILRKNLEDRVLSCLPAAFFGMGVFDDVAGQARRISQQPSRTNPTSASAFPGS